MPLLRITDTTFNEAEVILIDKQFQVISRKDSFGVVIKELVDQCVQNGLIAYLEPIKRKPHEINIVRRRVYLDDPCFLEQLGYLFKSKGYQVTYVFDKNLVDRKELENEIRRTLMSLSLNTLDISNRAIILRVLTKLSLDQLRILKADLR